MLVEHTLEPIYDKNSKVLILGSIPSLKSREVGFYYSHKKNRFWQTLSKIYQEEIPNDKSAKIYCQNEKDVEFSIYDNKESQLANYIYKNGVLERK